MVGVVALYGPEAPGRVVATAGEAELSRLAVASAERGRGIGRALVAHCERRARAAGWPAIALWSRAGQVEAHRLYESVGYERLAERDSVDGDRAAAARLPPRPRPGREDDAVIPDEQPLTTRLEGSLLILEPFRGRARRGAVGGGAARRDLGLADQHRPRQGPLRPLDAGMTLDAAASGAEGPFAIRRRADDVKSLIGSSRYLNVRRRDGSSRSGGAG